MAEPATAVALEPGKVGVAFDSEDYVVDARRTIAYAEAVGDANPAFLSGLVAPPAFAVVPVMHTMAAAMRAVAPSGFALHGEHDLRIAQPIRPGMRLRATATVAGLAPKSAGAVMPIRIVTRTAEGAAVNEQSWVNIVPHAKLAAAVGELPPVHAFPPGLRDAPPRGEIAYDLPAGLGRRYAEASGDHSPYTFDDDAARALGLPGAIMGGICTMSFAGRALVETCCDGQPARLRRLALRFARWIVLRAGQRLTVTMWSDPQDRSGRCVRFEMKDAAGDAVVTNGLAEIDA